jgi:hypothetical protein
MTLHHTWNCFSRATSCLRTVKNTLVANLSPEYGNIQLFTLAVKVMCLICLVKDHAISRIVNKRGSLPNDMMILDSSVNGVSVRRFQDLSGMATESMLSGISAFRIARDDKTIKQFLIHTFEHLGKPYDYDLITGNTDALYCSELVYESLKFIGIELPVQERLYGRDIISPNGAFNYIIQIGIPSGEFEMLFFLDSFETVASKFK